MKIKPILLALLYLGLIHVGMGIRLEHLLVISLSLGCYYAHPKSRNFIITFFPFLLFAILYDLLRIIPKEWAGPIHVEGPHRLEQALFGFQWENQKILPTDFFKIHTVPILDGITAFAYSLHMVVPLLFAAFLWWKNPGRAENFAWTFLLANLFAFLTYIFLPVAPPWYVESYGFAPGDWSIPGEAAGLVHFDERIGFPYFQKIYAQAAWVYGAIPSMHAGFPALIVFFARKWMPRALPLLISFMLLVWFSAVYLRHHYIIDIVAGVLYALAAFYLTKRPKE